MVPKLTDCKIGWITLAFSKSSFLPWRLRGFVCTDTESVRKGRKSRKHKVAGGGWGSHKHLSERKKKKKERGEVAERGKWGGRHPLFYIRLTHECWQRSDRKGHIPLPLPLSQTERWLCWRGRGVPAFQRKQPREKHQPSTKRLAATELRIDRNKPPALVV